MPNTSPEAALKIYSCSYLCGLLKMTSHWNHFIFTIQFLFQPRILLSYFVKYFWAICNFFERVDHVNDQNYRNIPLKLNIILLKYFVSSNTSTCHAVPIKINWIPLLHHYTSRLHSSIKPQDDYPTQGRWHYGYTTQKIGIMGLKTNPRYQPTKIRLYFGDR